MMQAVAQVQDSSQALLRQDRKDHIKGLEENKKHQKLYGTGTESVDVARGVVVKEPKWRMQEWEKDENW